MIERYSIKFNDELFKKITNSDTVESFESQYNAAPTKSLPIISIKSSDKLSFIYWGASPEYAKNRSLANRLINLDVSSFSKSNMLYNLLLTERCIIPCHGFYYWKKIAKKEKVPYYFKYEKSDIALCAGVKERYEDFEGNVFDYFSFITKRSNKDWKDYSGTIPLMVDYNDVNLWFNKNKRFDELLELMYQPSISDFNYYTVSPFISDLNNNDKNLTEPKRTSDQHGNYSLFN